MQSFMLKVCHTNISHQTGHPCSPAQDAGHAFSLGVFLHVLPMQPALSALAGIPLWSESYYSRAVEYVHLPLLPENESLTRS
jgi:hypothetical protein